MDRDHVDHLVRGLSHWVSRRGIFGVVVPAVFSTPVLADARKKGKRRRKKNRKGNNGQQPVVTFNAFGCVNVGDFCQNSGQCCSGICEGSACKAHDVATCLVGQTDFTCAGVTNVDCIAQGGDGRCLTTTGNAGYCAGDQVPPADGCVSCNKDADCISACGTGAACILCANCPEGRSCAGNSEDSCGG